MPSRCSGRWTGTAIPTAATGGGSSPTCVRRRASPPAPARLRGVRRGWTRDLAVCGRAVRLARVRDARSTAGCRSRVRLPIPPAARRSGLTATARHRRSTSPRLLLDGVPRRRPRPRRCGSPVAVVRDRLLPRRDRPDQRDTARDRVDVHPPFPRRDWSTPTPTSSRRLRRVVADHLPPERVDARRRRARGRAPATRSTSRPYPDRPLRALIDTDAIARRPRPLGAPASTTTAAGASTSPATRRSPPSNGAGTSRCGPSLCCAPTADRPPAPGLKWRLCRYPGKSLFGGFTASTGHEGEPLGEPDH